MRLFILLCICIVVGSITLNASEPAKRHTARFAGTYMFGSAIHEDADEDAHDYVGPGGTVILYPETDSTMLFFLQVEKGEPANATGRLAGKITLKSNKGFFALNNQQGIPVCKLSFQIEKKFLDIRTMEGLGDCGFGPGVKADNRFFRYSGEIRDHYEIDGKKILFEKTDKQSEKKELTTPVNSTPQ